MLQESLERILASLPDDARILDVGGWAAPFNPARWVIDLMPYESRGALMPEGYGPGPERFGADTWVMADLCSHEAWPFEDGYFDFVVCAFTLEDVRDPVRVCQEIDRVGRAGLIEVPSVLDELTWRVPEPSGGPWCGHAHHRWLCFEEAGELVFLAKSHELHSRRRMRVPPRWARRLSPRERVLSLFWEGELRARERYAIVDYPYAELEERVLERFELSPGERLLRDTAGRSRALLRRLSAGRKRS